MPQPVRRNDLLQRFASAESVSRSFPSCGPGWSTLLPCGIAILDGRTYFYGEVTNSPRPWSTSTWPGCRFC